MRFVAKVCTTALSVGLVVAFTTLLSGCDSSDKSPTYKPIESNILKKLGQSNPAESNPVAAKKAAQAQKK